MPANRLLQELLPETLARLQQDLVPVNLERGQRLTQVGEVMEHVYFPAGGLISVIVTVADGRSVEATTVGVEGFASLSALFGKSIADNESIVQVPGPAERLTLEAFQAYLEGPPFRRVVESYASSAIAAIAQSSACLAFHPVEERLARWLATVSDGIEK